MIVMPDKNLQVIIQVFEQETQGIHLENQLLMLLADALIVFLIWLILHKKKKVPAHKYAITFLFLAYMGVVLSITLFRRPEGSREGIVNLFINLGFGLKTGNPSFRVSVFSIFNILLFVPLGMLTYPEIRKKTWVKGVFFSTIIGAVFSLFIECTQLITGRGMFEVTDLLTNTTGSLIGALIVALVRRVQSKSVYSLQKD